MTETIYRYKLISSSQRTYNFVSMKIKPDEAIKIMYETRVIPQLSYKLYCNNELIYTYSTNHKL